MIHTVFIICQGEWNRKKTEKNLKYRYRNILTHAYQDRECKK